jgi:hypothetical protein
MPFDYQAHNRIMVDHFIWLETAAPPGYAVEALITYRLAPNSPNPGILVDVKAEKARRLMLATRESENSSANTDLSAPLTTSGLK